MTGCYGPALYIPFQVDFFVRHPAFIPVVKRIQECVCFLAKGIAKRKEHQVGVRSQNDTLPETKIFTESKPLEKEIPIGNHHF